MSTGARQLRLTITRHQLMAYRAAMADAPTELPPLDPSAFADRYGPRALVAGGATGLGAEYCRQIAATGIDLLVLDRDESALAATASELRSAPDPVDVVTAVVDLGQPPEILADLLRRAVGELEIGLLVANAAWSPVGRFLDVELSDLLAAVNINCRAPVVLIHELGARMATHGRGGIIVMSSLAAEAGAANVRSTPRQRRSTSYSPKGSGTSCASWVSTSSRSVRVPLALRDGSPRNPSAASSTA